MARILDTLTYADGSLATGRLVITWNPFTVGNVNAAGGQLEWEIVDGVLDVTLYANVDASPLGSYYTAKYELQNGKVYYEQWIVPDLATVTLGQVRVSFPPTPSVLISPLQLTAIGAQPGMFLQWNGTKWVPAYPGDFGMTDPTTTLGDLIVRGASTITRLGVGSNGQVLTADSAQPLGLGWAIAVSAPDTSVQQVRLALAGTVKATRPQVNFVAGSGVNLNLVDDVANNEGTLTITAVGTGAPSPSIFSVNGAQIGIQPELNLIAGSNTTLVGANNTGAGRVDITVSAVGGVAPVTSVFTRTGAVVAASADYSAFYPLLAGSYVDPIWIASLSWGKITGAPSVSSYQTPWLTDIYAGFHSLVSLGGLSMLSGAAGSYVALVMGRTAQESVIAIAATAGQWSSLAAIGDLVIRSEAQKVVIGSGGTGTMAVGAGLVGFGFNSPQVPVDILAAAGSPGSALRMRQSNASATEYFTFIVDSAVNGALRIDGYDGGTTATGFCQQRNGNCGVHTQAPVYPFHCVGGIVSDPGGNAVQMVGIGVDVANASAGQSMVSLIYDTSIAMGRLEALTQGAAFRSINIVPRGGSLCVGPSFAAGQVPLALCDFSTDAADAKVLMLRCAINSGGQGPSLVFGQNSGSALQCSWKATYNGSHNAMDLAFFSYDNGTTGEKMRIMANGWLAVAKTSAAYAIDATGDINCTGAFRVNGTPVFTGGIGLTAGVSSPLGLTASAQDVPGTTFTLPTTGLWLLIATVHFQGGNGDVTLNAIANMIVGGVQQPFGCWWAPGSTGGSEGVSTSHQITRQNAGTVVKLQGLKTGTAGATITTASCFSAVYIST